MDDKDDNDELHRQVRTSWPAVEIIPLRSELKNQLDADLPRLSQTHHLDGLCIDSESPVFVVNATEEFPAVQTTPVKVFVWGWDGFFGGAFSILIAWSLNGRPGRAGMGRVYIPQAAKVLDQLKSRRFTVAFADKSRQLAKQVLVVDYNKNSASRDFFDTHLNLTMSHKPRFRDPKAHYWETLFNKESLWTREDRLRFGWMKTYRGHVDVIDRYRAWVLSGDDQITIDPLIEKLDERHQNLVRQICDLSTLTDEVVELVRAEFGCDMARFWEIVTPFKSPSSPEIDGEFTDAGKLHELLIGIFQIACLGSDVTDCGRKLIWQEIPPQEANTLRIDCESFPKTRDPREFWPSLPKLCLGWPTLLEAGDFPLSAEWCRQHWQRFPVAEDVERTNELTTELLREACENKLGTIPPGAIVELRVGPFSHIELLEQNDWVFFLFRREDGEFLSGFLDPRELICFIYLPVLASSTVAPEEPPANAAAVLAALKLLVSAMVRDFWVVEKRERVFGTRNGMQRRKQQSKNADAGARIVYLPRIRYEQQRPSEAAMDELGLEARPSHPVSAHLRRLHEGHEASQYALFLAQRYGIRVPEGHTFVRPYDTGHEKRDVIYRSRSALQTLYHSLPSWTTVESNSDWFRFERDVCDFMRAQGFEVEHISASSSADHGIDVYATKGEKLDRICWVIQCKCWSPKRRVGPEVVRDLIGALERHPRGTRGMVITTSTFTDGANDVAKESGIMLVDGPEFTASVKGLGRLRS